MASFPPVLLAGHVAIMSREIRAAGFKLCCPFVVSIIRVEPCSCFHHPNPQIERCADYGYKSCFVDLFGRSPMGPGICLHFPFLPRVLFFGSATAQRSVVAPHLSSVFLPFISFFCWRRGRPSIWLMLATATPAVEEESTCLPSIPHFSASPLFLVKFQSTFHEPFTVLVWGESQDHLIIRRAEQNQQRFRIWLTVSKFHQQPSRTVLGTHLFASMCNNMNMEYLSLISTGPSPAGEPSLQ